MTNCKRRQTGRITQSDGMMAQYGDRSNRG